MLKRARHPAKQHSDWQGSFSSKLPPSCLHVTSATVCCAPLKLWTGGLVRAIMPFLTPVTDAPKMPPDQGGASWKNVLPVVFFANMFREMMCLRQNSLKWRARIGKLAKLMSLLLAGPAEGHLPFRRPGLRPRLHSTSCYRPPERNGRRGRNRRHVGGVDHLDPPLAPSAASRSVGPGAGP